MRYEIIVEQRRDLVFEVEADSQEAAEHAANYDIDITNEYDAGVTEWSFDIVEIRPMVRS